MLIDFKFSNYMSFKEETEFSMAAASISEHKKSLIEINGVNILPLAGIYGANASGKSNFFSAFNCMSDIITLSRGAVREGLGEKAYAVPYIFAKEFFEKGESLPTTFEVRLGIGEYSYKYGFACKGAKLLREWLYKQKISKNDTVEKLIYKMDFEKDILQCGNISKEQKNEIEYCFSMSSGKMLLLTDIGRREKNEELFDIFNWFECAAVITTSDDAAWQKSSEHFICKHISDNRDNNLFCIREKNLKDELARIINEIDPAISDIAVYKKEMSNGREDYEMVSVHKVENVMLETPFSIESDGTQRTLALSMYILGALASGSPLFVDEIDYRLHPLLLRKIIKMFADREINTLNAQLIFSAHNIINLDSSDLRRDEVWFVEKNNHCSSMYSLYDFDDDDRVRNDLDFGKHYLSGRFGAIPFQKGE